MCPVEKMEKKDAMVIALSCLLLVAFIVVSANVDDACIKAHTPTEKHVVQYPEFILNGQSKDNIR